MSRSGVYRVVRLRVVSIRGGGESKRSLERKREGGIDTSEPEEWRGTDADATNGATTVFITAFTTGPAFTDAWLVDDGAMFETAEIKHAHAAVGTAARKHVDAAAHEAHVVHLLIVGDQLRFSRQCGNIPDGTGGVDATRDDQARADGVPV